MALPKSTLDQLKIEAGETFRIADHHPDWLPEQVRDLSKEERKERAEQMLAANKVELAEAQELLYADGRHSVLIVFQAMDAAGKDGTISHVMSGVNPQGCSVASFKVPSAVEWSHNYLWRYSNALPARGMIGIFNRSYYEEVLVVRVHPELLEKQRLPAALRGDDLFDRRYDDIRSFERYLTRNGIVIRKFFLHVSKDEQRKRFLERLDTPEKQWKFSAADLAERGRWDEYQQAYEEMVRHTAADDAPWYVVPADHKWFTRLVVAGAVIDALASLDLRYPKVGKAQSKQLDAAREALQSEK